MVPESSSILFTSDLELDRNREGTELHDFEGPICCKYVTDFLHSSFIGILIKLDRCTLLLFTLTIRFEIMIGIGLDSLGYLGISLPIKLLLGVKRELVEIGRNDAISNWVSWLGEQSRGNSDNPSFRDIRYAGMVGSWFADTLGKEIDYSQLGFPPKVDGKATRVLGI